MSLRQANELINKGTNDSAVARSWHLNNVAVDAKTLINDLRSMQEHYTDQKDKDSLESEIKNLNKKLETFLNKYPEPTKTKIIDNIDICDILPVWQRLLPLHFRPNEPLTLLNDIEGNKYLYYRKSDNEVIKVVNSASNRPNNSVLTEYAY
ncbi:hypothetical protein [Pseudoalteromonas marina]|uniref:Uncharacterized protein n=1 Tax=Pseudoalteromonas marina TaxID=267375 RepID=A0ABT9FI11_9GAMM|nr:hypothetical protein [Pseudoalteromonas marina]MDP2566427.1 hypothetical protein [Pseudoalteromonas marina]